MESKDRDMLVAVSLALFLCAMLLILTSCTVEQGPKGADAVTPTLSVLPATAAQCPVVGGSQFIISGVAEGYVCNGAAGTPGTSIQGTPGAPALPTEVLPATLQECLNGGTDIILGSVISMVCNGAQGQTGTQGPAGGIGAAGPPGATGPPGINATPISVMQFCPSVVPAYPTTFPEFGLCIGNNLFGVYSTNGGFLAQLPPGAYLSNAVGSSCDFNIGLNCSISY